MAKNLIDISIEKLMEYALIYYKISMGKKCNIQNPSLFTEKIQWYTFFYNNPICPYIVDKVTFKSYIEEKLGAGYTIPMYGSWKSVDEFEKAWFSEILPDEFCLKANLQSDGRNRMVKTRKHSYKFICKKFLYE